MTYETVITKTFSKEFKKHKKDGEFVNALDKKIQKLKENPHSAEVSCQESFTAINQRE